MPAPFEEVDPWAQEAQASDEPTEGFSVKGGLRAVSTPREV